MVSESAVLIPVPEAERVVSGHRDRLDRAAAWGVPAHVTVFYPFVAPPTITAATIAVLADAVRSISAFDCGFPATGWFGQEVLWLAPQSDEPFRALTQAVSAAFPDTCRTAASTTMSFLISRSVTGQSAALPNCGQQRWRCCAGCPSGRALAVCG